MDHDTSGILSLPAGVRALADALACLCAFVGGIIGALAGAILHWPIDGIEILIGAGIPFAVVAGGARVLWAAYMIFSMAVLYLIARID